MNRSARRAPKVALSDAELTGTRAAEWLSGILSRKATPIAVIIISETKMAAQIDFRIYIGTRF